MDERRTRWNTRVIAGAAVVGPSICFPGDWEQGKPIFVDVVFFVFGSILLVSDFMIWLKVRRQKDSANG